MPKACIVAGLGSMGMRRIRLLKQLEPDMIIGGVDTRQERRAQAQEQAGIHTYSDLKTAIAQINPGFGFVCTSPTAHHKLILELLNSELHVFTEINLVDDGYDEIIALAKEKGKTVFLSSTFLYRREIEWMKNRIGSERVNYIFHVGQYLPDWHPWESYQNFFVAEKRSNGCRELFAIDLPWIRYLFGEITDFSALKDKNSQLEIDYADNYFVTFQHENGNKGVMVNDLISRNAGRRLEVFSENIHVTWNGTPDSLWDFNTQKKENQQVLSYTEYEHHEKYHKSIIEDAYKEEILSFFRAVSQQQKPRYTFEDDKRTLKIIDRIEGIV